MIIYGVYMAWQPEDILRNLFLKAEDAQAFIDSMRHPLHYYIEEMQVY